MPALTIHLSDELYNRLAEYARNEAGTLPERAARDILEEFLAEDYERLPETGEMLYDSDDGHQHNPDWLNEMIPARFIERDYGLAAGTVRSYVRYHPELAESGDFEKRNAEVARGQWYVRREAAEKIWRKS